MTKATDRIVLRGRSIELDARAAQAFYACRSASTVLPSSDVSLDQLRSMLAVRRVAILPVKDEDKALRAVGGFEALELLTALALCDQQPSSIAIEAIDPSDQAVTAAIQAELLAALRRPVLAQPAVLDKIVTLLTIKNAISVFGCPKPTRKRIAQVCAVDMRRYVRPRQLASGADSGILAQILAY